MNAEMLEAVRATQEASHRVRWVFLITLSTCILVFMALWRETPFAWSASRLQTARAVSWYLDCVETHGEHGTDGSEIFSRSQRHDLCHYAGPTPLFSDREVERAKRFLQQTKLTPAQARDRMSSLQKLEIEHILNVTVPVLGVSFDINDLGLLGGITFLFLAVWFHFCLVREEENVDALFDRARAAGELPAVYSLLAMTQVLLSPPRIDGRHTNFWSRLPGLLVWSPALIQPLTVVNDWATLSLGSAVGRMALSVAIAETLIWFAILIMTLEGRKIGRELDRHWDEAFHEIQSAAPTPGRVTAV